MWNQLFGDNINVILHLRKLNRSFTRLNDVMDQVPVLFDSLDLRCKTLWCLSSRFALDTLWQCQRMKLWQQWRSLADASYNVDAFIMDTINRYGYYQNLHVFTSQKVGFYYHYENVSSTLFKTSHGNRVHVGYCNITRPPKPSNYQGHFLCKACKSKCFIVKGASRDILMHKINVLEMYKQLITMCKMWSALWKIVYPNNRKSKIKTIHIPDDVNGFQLFETKICEKCNDHVVHDCAIHSTHTVTKYGRPVMLCLNCYNTIRESINKGITYT